MGSLSHENTIICHNASSVTVICVYARFACDLLCYSILSLELRDVAQLGRALGSGPRGRWFKSSHPDHCIGRQVGEGGVFGGENLDLKPESNSFERIKT